MLIRTEKTIRVRVATIVAAALTLLLAQCRSDNACVLAAADAGQAAGIGDCNVNGATTPCFEKVWVGGAATSGLLTLVDTASVFIARIDPDEKSSGCE